MKNIKTEEVKLREEIERIENLPDELYEKNINKLEKLKAKLQQLLADKKMFQDAIEKLKIKSIKEISKNMNVEPKALCQFGNLGLMTIEDLVNTFYGEELLKTLGI